MIRTICISVLFFVAAITLEAAAQVRSVIDFNRGWKFRLGDAEQFKRTDMNDGSWRVVDLPHDWSIEGKFDSTWPAGNAGGALPGGIGWYRKTFKLPASANGRKVLISFDGVYRNSEVWLNDHYLGKWPYGYTPFDYDLTPWVNQGGKQNVIAVRVNNADQPNSRWYSGSGIYRDVRLIITNQSGIKHRSLFVTTPIVSASSATVRVDLELENLKAPVKVRQTVYDAGGRLVASRSGELPGANKRVSQSLKLSDPKLWSVSHPNLYKLVTTVYQNQKVIDADTTVLGIRTFSFDAQKGFSLNGENMKILGVCMHHDLGALGAAFNQSAARRQLQILKEMGCNAIRTAHNPPASGFLDLCDEMGFLVMDESFDMWAKKKNKFDYHLDFPEWHKKDLEAMVLRDRNHPSVFMWSIGNEIREQFDSTGITLSKELVGIIKALDSTRPVTCALSENDPKKNFIYQSKALDVVGLNYHIEAYEDFPKNYPGEKFIGAENVSGLASRGHYDMPSDSIRFWPPSSRFKYAPDGNPDYTVSAYDNVAAYWGSTHEQTWRLIKKHDFLSGLFVWSGFDFLGEPIPYPYPARSSYYGIVDLAGFPKDVYYMYQSEWTDKPVLHLFPHWNWQRGKLVDVKAYYNNADEAELFLNGRSIGIKSKTDTSFHVMWRVRFEPGTLKVVSRKNGKVVLTREIHTAGAPAKIELTVDRRSITQRNNDLIFATVRILDKDGNLVPDADNLVSATATGGTVVAMDNGYPADLNNLRDDKHHAYKGLCLAIVKPARPGICRITAAVNRLAAASVEVLVR
jgi:beta-galactosidase